MASYAAVIDLRVNGLDRLRTVEDSVNTLNRLIKSIKPVPSIFDKRANEQVKTLKTDLEALVGQYGKAGTKGKEFSSSIAGINNQLQAFRAIAANATAGTDSFRDALSAAAKASNALLEAELKKFDTLNKIYTQKPGERTKAGQAPTGIVSELLALKTQVPNSVAALERYQKELLDVQNTVSMTSLEYRELAAAINQVDVALGRGGEFGPKAPPVQGPALPNATTLAGAQARAKAAGTAKPAATGLQAPGVMDAILGGAFPALFGAGPGAMAGGAIGGLVGGKMGGIGGMALSIAFSAVGQQIDEAIKKVKDLGDAIQLVDVDKLRESFVFVNDELEVAITRSIRLGDLEGARALAAAAAAEQTGALGTAIRDSANATNMLGDTWRKVSGSVSTLLSLLAAPFAAALAGILELVNLVAVGWNKIISLVGTGLKNVGEFVIRLFGGQEAVDYIQRGFENLNILQNRANAAAQLKLDVLKEEVMISSAILNIEKQRTQGVTAEQKLQNIDVDLRQKKLNLVAELWKTEQRVREENKGASSEKIEALVKEEQQKTAIAIQQAELVAQREREKTINQEILANDRLRAEILQAQNQVVDAQAQTAQKLLSINIDKLNQQREFALYLNEETAIIEKIAALKQQTAELEYQNTLRQQDLKVQLAALELQSVEAEYERGFATEQSLAKARLLYDVSMQVREAVVAGAAAEREHAAATAELERRKQTVAAFTADIANQTAAATRDLQEQASAVQNNLTLTQEIATAQKTINNTKIEQLQTELAMADTAGQRYDTIYKIRDLEIANARITYEATLAQINANVELKRIAAETAQLKLREYEAIVRMAEAQGVVTRQHYEALKAQESALRIALGAYDTAVKTAQVQKTAAGAVYDASVYAATLKAETALAATAAGTYADNMQRGAKAAQAAAQAASGGGGGFPIYGIGGEAQKNPYIIQAAREALSGKMFRNKADWDRALEGVRDMAEAYNKAKARERMESAKKEYETTVASNRNSMLPGFASGGYVTRSQLAMIGEGGQPEYVIPSSKMDQAMANYAAGRRGSQVLSPQVNITTGPVTQMDGTNYVTMSDLRQATSTAARQGANLALSQLQTNPSLRRSIGVAR